MDFRIVFIARAWFVNSKRKTVFVKMRRKNENDTYLNNVSFFTEDYVLKKMKVSIPHRVYSENILEYAQMMNN